ncbi:MAG TPA: histidine phosphatase family protein, partial [Gemmatimonadota bacterium]|nr:histidine phosphatase family protein [Gemmatimonadota bacterium]
VHRGERIVCVSHGGPIRLALSKVLDRPLTDRDAFGVVNGSWFEIARRFGSAAAGGAHGAWWLESSGKAG